MILSLAYSWEAGVMLMWSTLRSRADLDHVALGTAGLLVGSTFLLLGIAHLPDAWTLGMAAGFVVRVAFLLLGVAALLLGGVFLLDSWALAGVPFLLFGVAALLGGTAAFPERMDPGRGRPYCWVRSRPCCSGVVFLLDRGALTRGPVSAGRGRGPAERGSRPCWPDGR